MRRAIQQFDMIKEGDRIAVGLSGGKDSTALLVALKRYQYFSPTGGPQALPILFSRSL